MSLQSWALTTLADAKVFLNTGNVGTYDAVLEQLINEVSARIELYCGHRLVSTVYQKAGTPSVDTRLKLDGNGSSRIRFPQFPLTTLTSAVYSEGGVETAIDLTNAHVDRDAGMVELESDVWMAGFQNVLVTCTCGYLAGTHDRELMVLRRACHYWLGAWWLEWKNAIAGATEVGEVKLPEEDPPPRVAAMLEPFVWREWS